MGAYELAERLKSMSDAEVAAFVGDHATDPSNSLLGKQELENRARLHQHELDRKLIAIQVRWMKFSVLAALAGVILEWYLQRGWPPTQLQNTPPAVQSPSKVLDPKEKADSAPSKSPREIVPMQPPE